MLPGASCQVRVPIWKVGLPAGVVFILISRQSTVHSPQSTDVVLMVCGPA